MQGAIEIENREELFFFLAEAAELEHMLCCSYLYAAFSLKGVGEGLSETQLAAVSEWKKQIRKIAVQEMGHLAVVNNLLVAIGGAPHFQRPNFPQRGKYYPPHIHLSLAPFTEATLEHFVFIERPRKEQNDAQPPVPERNEQTVTDHEVMPEPQSYATVGDLYDGIESGLRRLVDRYGEAAVFVGPPRVQARQDMFDLPGLIAVSDLASASAAITQVVEEGEGTRGEREDAHYGYFRQMQREYKQLKEKDPTFSPARRVLANPCTRLPSDATGAALVESQATVDLMDLFNATYGLMVQLLARFFVHTEETEEEVGRLVDVAVTAMTTVLAPLGDLITRLPAGPSFGDLSAGPSFEFHRALQPPPHRDGAWTVLREKSRELVDYSKKVRGRSEVARELETIHDALVKIAGELET